MKWDNTKTSNTICKGIAAAFVAQDDCDWLKKLFQNDSRPFSSFDSVLWRSGFTRLTLHWPSACCVPSVLASAHILHLCLRMGCTCTSIKVQVKSKPLPGPINKSLMPWLPFSLPSGCCFVQNGMKLSTLIKNSDSKTESIWLNKTCQIGQTRVIMPRLCLSVLVTGWPVLFGSTVCLDGAEWAKSGALTDLCSHCCLCQSTGCERVLSSLHWLRLIACYWLLRNKQVRRGCSI